MFKGNQIQKGSYIMSRKGETTKSKIEMWCTITKR